jgi:hypothetical protein
MRSNSAPNQAAKGEEAEPLWAYFDTTMWDADHNLREFLAAMPESGLRYFADGADGSRSLRCRGIAIRTRRVVSKDVAFRPALDASCATNRSSNCAALSALSVFTHKFV